MRFADRRLAALALLSAGRARAAPACSSIRPRPARLERSRHGAGGRAAHRRGAPRLERNPLRAPTCCSFRASARGASTAGSDDLAFRGGPPMKHPVVARIAGARRSRPARARGGRRPQRRDEPRDRAEATPAATGTIVAKQPGRVAGLPLLLPASPLMRRFPSVSARELVVEDGAEVAPGTASRRCGAPRATCSRSSGRCSISCSASPGSRRRPRATSRRARGPRRGSSRPARPCPGFRALDKYAVARWAEASTTARGSPTRS